MSDNDLNKEIKEKITKIIKDTNFIETITNQPENIMLTHNDVNDMAISDMFNYDETVRIIYDKIYDILMPFFKDNLEEIILDSETSKTIEERVTKNFINIKIFYDMIFFHVIKNVLTIYSNNK